MNYNNDFKYDLKIGQLGEKHLNEILNNKKIEVKTDFKAQKTGNILSNEQLVLIRAFTLKNICRCYIGTNRDVRGGDNNTSKGVLVPITELTK